MKVDIGFQPNCSEVVLHISSLSKEELLELLGNIGIKEMEIDRFYDFYDDEEPTQLLIDSDNPSFPDVVHHSKLRVEEGYVGAGNYPDGCCIVGSQHCQEQMFPTMKKIVDYLREAVDSSLEWSGDDGGSTTDYEEWVSSGKPGNTVDNRSFDILCGRVRVSQVKELLDYCETTYGFRPSKDRRGSDIMIFGTYNPSTVKPCIVHPSKFGGLREWEFARRIKKDLMRKMNEIIIRSKSDSKTPKSKSKKTGK